MSKLPASWVPPLASAGFRKKAAMMVRKKDGIEQSVYAKQNTHNTTFQIWTTVSVADPYRKDHLVPIFYGYITPSALRFFAVDEGWWPQEKLPEAIDAISAFGIPWLDKHFDDADIVFDVEQCLQRNQSWNYYFEKREDAIPITTNFRYIASLLHLRLGNKEASCKRAYEWLGVVKSNTWGDEPARTLRQMKDMGCEQNALVASLLSQPIPAPEPVVVRKVDEEFLGRLRDEKLKPQ